jgi:multicomponent Na+:H+ antiporter subunit G
MDIIIGIVLLLGSFFILVSSVGLLRMPDLFTRMSATTKASTLGVVLVMLGTALIWQDIGITARVVIIISFLFLTAPVAAHIIGRAAYFDKVPLWDQTIVDELKGRYDDRSHELKSHKDS